MSSPITPKAVADRVVFLERKLARFRAQEAVIAAKRERVEGEIAALRQYMSVRPRPSAPVISFLPPLVSAPVTRFADPQGFEKEDPWAFKQSFEALRRIEAGTGVVEDIAEVQSLTPEHRAELLAKFAERVGPIARFTNETN